MLKLLMYALSLLLLPVGEVAAGKLSLTDTITWGGDNSRSGYQPTHNMDPSVVGSAQFGQLWKAVLPGNYRGFTEQIYSQSLVYTLDDGIQYLFVSTTQNNVYKINAKTGTIVASRNLHVPFLTSDLDGCVDINPTVGVTATGVIDPATDTWYLTAKTYLDQSDQVKGRLNGRYYFHAIDVNTLAEQPNFPIGLEGTIGSNNANRMFQSGNAHQRPALLHTGQYVYAGFASHCVQYNFTGWIMGWDKTSGALVERFTTEGGPEANTVPGGGVWMSGGGIASDNKGSMFFATGNGYTSQLQGTPVPGRQPPTALEEAAVNMKINDDGSLKVVDFFMPWEKVQLDGADKDLGTTPLELLQPDVFTCPNVKRMGVVIGKSGKMYILNLDNLGGYQEGVNKLDAVPQVIQNENSVYAGAGVYPLEGGYLYINVIQYPTHVFKFSCDASGNPSFTKVGDSPEKNAYILGVGHGTTTSLNGQAGTGLLWVSDVDGYNLRVYNAIPQNGKLQLIQTANVAGITKFTRPVFGDGRAYLGTTQGALYCFGSPVNLPLTCTSPNDFGTVVINSTSAAKTIQCQANIDTQVTAITIKSANFRISSLPTLPFSVNKGDNVSFQAVFAPAAPGPLSNDVLLAMTNGVAGYASTTPVSLKGVSDSLAPLLAVTPNVVSFEGVITGQQAGGVEQSVIFANQGDGILHIVGIDYSIISETGGLVTPNNTADGAQVGPFTFKNLPTTISGNSQAIVNINFNPTQSGNYAVYLQVRTDGGTKIFDVVGTAGTYPVAFLEFQAADGSGKWIPYTNNSPPFTFGSVYEQTTKILKMRLTNNGSSSAASLSVTVSKPPFGVSGIVGAQNGVDLAEGTILAAGESATADLFCSVPKSQVNVDAYNGTALWTMNTGDPNFGKQFIQFTCNAISEQVGPLYPNGSAIYRYDGCWKENNPGRQLKVQLWGQDPNNSNDKCIAACAAQSYTYAGTQYVSECWCGNKIPTLLANETECNYACSGADSETCGGNGYFHDGSFISLFSNKPGIGDVAPPGAPAVVPTVGNYAYTGCYTEGTSGRALGAKNTASDDMTVEKCAAFCTGYQYFGIEYASECYCDNALGAGSSKVDETVCSMTCSGNDTEICGDGNRLTLYTLIGSSGNSSSTSTPTSGINASISTSSSAGATATGPVAVSKAATYLYQGCYTEGTNVRALSASATAGGDMTVEKCATFCSGYTYMGVEYSTECYCANSIGDGAVLTSSGCSMTCGGNSAELCGGPNRLNFYKVDPKASITSSSSSSSPASSSSASSSPASSSPASTTTPPSSTTASGPSSISTAGNFFFAGCYSEGTNGRALADKTTAAGTMTVEICAAFCSGYSYMGVEYSTECYCGNNIAAGSVSTGSGCSMTCGGNANEYCGGPNRLNIYQAGSSSSSSAFGSTTKTSSTSSSSAVASSTNTSFASPSLAHSITTIKSSTSTSTITPSATATGPAVVQGNANFTYTACYVDSGARTLSQLVLANDQITVEVCLQACSQYTYAGLEYGRECWCANTLASGAATATAESQCNMNCVGSSSEICGAGNRLTLYTHNVQVKPQAKFALAALAPVRNVSDGLSLNSVSQTSYISSSFSVTSSGFITSSKPTASGSPTKPSSSGSMSGTKSITVGSSPSSNSSTSAISKFSSGLLSSATAGRSSGLSSSSESKSLSAQSSTSKKTFTSKPSSVSPSSTMSKSSSTFSSVITSKSSFASSSSTGRQSSSSLSISSTSKLPVSSIFIGPISSSSISTSPTSKASVQSSSTGLRSSSSLSASSSSKSSVTSTPTQSKTAAIISVSTTSESSTVLSISTRSKSPSPVSSFTTSKSTFTSPSSTTPKLSSTPSTSPSSKPSSKLSSSITTKAPSKTISTSSLASKSFSSSKVLSSTNLSSVSSGTLTTTTKSSSSILSSFVTSRSSSSKLSSSSTKPSSSNLSNSILSSASLSSQSSSSKISSSITLHPLTSITPTTLQTLSRTPTIKPSTSSTSIRINPTPSQVVNSWTYLGCANQTSPLALSGMHITSPGEMTLETCQALCLKNYYGLAGLEDGDTCTCGNGLQSYSALGHESCNTPCSGNSSETCGGKDSQGKKYLSVWNSTSTSIIPTFVKQVGAYPLQGCFLDSAKIGLTATTYTSASTMTAESCVGFCITKNYAYAGLNNGNTCFCDHALAPAATLWDDVRCTKLCSGNSREFCGGQNGLLVYKLEQSSVVDGVPKRANEDNTPLG